MRRTAHVERRRQLLQVAAHGQPLVLRQEPPRRRAGHVFRLGRRSHFQILAPPVRRFDPGALAAQRQRRIVADRVVDHRGHDLAVHDGGRHAAEQRQAGGIVGGAVHRIDHEGEIGPFQPVQQRLVGRGRFLAHHHTAGEHVVQPGGDDPFRRLVRLGHQIERAGLGAHVARAEPAEARHDLGARGHAQQQGEFGQVAQGECGHAGVVTRAPPRNKRPMMRWCGKATMLAAWQPRSNSRLST